MTTAEAAQRWAEAKDKLGAATAALDQANTAHDAAAKDEHEAWEALEQLAGRVPVIAQETQLLRDALGRIADPAPTSEDFSTYRVKNAGCSGHYPSNVPYNFDDGFIK